MNSTITSQQISPTNTALIEQIYRLRYQVYVRERGFLPAQNYPEGMEKDHFDTHSVHFAALEPCGCVVGTVRLILPQENPTQMYDFRDQLEMDQEHFHYRHAEISRFAISKAYTLKRSAQNYLNPITFGLYKAMMEYCDAHQIPMLLALMENPLAMMLQRCGIDYSCIGLEMDLYGKVRPYKIMVEDQRQLLQSYFTKQETPHHALSGIDA